MIENRIYRLGSDTKANLKNGDRSLDYINRCWLIMPDFFKLFLPDDLIHFASGVERSIAEFSHGHMLDFKAEEALDHMKLERAALLTDPQQNEVLGFCKVHGWQNAEGRIAGWEFGSLFVHPSIRSHHVAQYLTEQLVSHTHFNGRDQNPPPPIFAVVTVDNEASLKLFRRMGWRESHPTFEETMGFTEYKMNGVNIYEDWGKDSIVFFYENASRL